MRTLYNDKMRQSSGDQASSGVNPPVTEEFDSTGAIYINRI